jgi:hypothetical protein
MSKYGPKAQEKVKKVLEEYKNGETNNRPKRY